MLNVIHKIGNLHISIIDSKITMINLKIGKYIQKSKVTSITF